MSAWVLVPSLVKLTQEFNDLAPGRDKGADGSIGDSSHTSSSDHTPDEDSRILRDHDADDKNEVHAKDIDSSGPWPGTGTQKQRFHAVVMRIIAGERRKWLSATDRCRLNYVIWDSWIYDKDNDFEPVRHTGPDPHTNHAHFSNRYETSCENDTRSWGVYVPSPPPEKEDDSMEQAEFDKLYGAAIHKVTIGRSGQTVAAAFDQIDQALAAAQAAATQASAAASAAVAAVEKLDQIIELVTPDEPEEPDNPNA